MYTNPFKREKLATALACATLATPAIAQDNDDLDQLSGLEEVIVTAQYVEQSEQDIPIAMTAFSGETLEARGQTNTAMIGAQAPNVQLLSGGSSQGNALIAFIRGVGQQDNSPALEPGVGIYINDVYFNNVQGTLLELLDLERVEISRGPQGTLAGKNSIGGAIKMYTKRPNDELDAFVEVGAGDLDALKLRGGTNITFSDELYARVSGVYNERDGYVDVLDAGCAFPALGAPSATSNSGCKIGTQGGIENQAARLALSWTPSDTFALDFTADYLDEENEPAANLLSDIGPTLAPIFFAPPSAENPLPLAWPWVNPGPDADPNLPPTNVVPVLESAVSPCIFITNPDSPSACFDQQAALGGQYRDGYTSFSTFTDPATGFAAPTTLKFESTSYSVNLDWDITEDMRIESITAYRNYETGYPDDPDGSPFGLSNQFNTQEHDAYSQEFRLNGIVNDGFSYVVGAFYQETETEIGGRIGQGSNGLDFLVDDIVETESFALFANTIIAINDRLEFSGGLRFSDDEKSFAFQRLNIDGSSPVACDRIEVAPGVVVLNPTSSPNCLVGGLNDTPAQTFADDRVDYRAALSYFPTDNVTLFASASTGYKAGGANARPFFAEQLITHDSEEVTAFELGGKFDLLDNTLRLNASVFQNDYEDIIVTLFDCSSVVGSQLLGNPCFLPVNLGKADVQGFELEVDWAPIAGLLIDGSYGYLDFEYTDTGGVLPTDTQQAYTPETTWSIGAQYELNTSIGTFTPRVDVYYQDDIFTQPENSPASLIESRTLANASITWADEQNNWQVRARVENLTDEYYNFQATDFVGGGNGYSNTNPAAPRTYMVTVRRNFN